MKQNGNSIYDRKSVEYLDLTIHIGHLDPNGAAASASLEQSKKIDKEVGDCLLQWIAEIKSIA